jgi:hypothetical protein
MITILGIHGVGRQVKGTVRSEIAAAVSETGYEAQTSELYWTDQVDLVSTEDIFLLTNVRRSNEAMLSIASYGFYYFNFSKNICANYLLQLFDSIIFISFHILFLLIPIAVVLQLFDLWFEAKTMGSGTF